jgi:hypothetical protein
MMRALAKMKCGFRYRALYLCQGHVLPNSRLQPAAYRAAFQVVWQLRRVP